MRATTVVVALLATLTAGCGAVVAVEPVGTVDLDRPAETSVVTDSAGGVLAELHAEQDRDLITLGEISTVLQDAVVAVEDARFASHSGVDGRAVARALLENARVGRVSEGGSTITQQLAKNVATGDAQTLARKLEEASVALQLEAQLTKDEILEHYLNTVYFGNGAYGVQTAARRYFGVDAGELTLPQAALLAGLLKAPSNYDPLTDPEAAISRRNVVLDVMARRGVIDPATAEAARSAALGLDVQTAGQSREAPYFVAHVLDLLQHDDRFTALGEDPSKRADALFRGGLEIETTLDPDWQDAAETALADTLHDPEDPSGALVAIDPGSGGIRALVGGRDYDDADDPISRFNLATQAERQPGSTFKTVALAAALADGHTLEERVAAPASLELPAREPEEAEPWTVTNYDDRELGELSLREATVSSANTAYASLADEVGADRIAEMGHALGISGDRVLRPYRSLVLGSQEVSVLDMASVQATLAAGGIHREPTAVVRITGPDGTVWYERGTEEGTRVLDEGTAWLVTEALEGVIEGGTGQRAALERPVAGKTGTGQRSADAWFTGYTPDMAAAVWVGFPEGLVPMVPPTTRARVEGGTWPAEIFARFGMSALADVPASSFAIPESELVHLAVDTSGECLPTAFTPRNHVGQRAFLRGTEPTTPCDIPDEPPTDDVPSVIGMTADDAEDTLERAGFRVRRRPEFSGSLPPGLVLRQGPEPGEVRELPRGYEATLWVSSADRATTAVPDSLNTHRDEAIALLEDSGFVVEVREECPDGSGSCTGALARPGTVWEQSPDTRGDATVHSVVTIAVYPEG